MRIFISGTKSDIKPERDAVIRLFSYLKLSFEVMEFFTSSETEPIETCLEKVRACSIFILIIAHSYGTIEETSGLSFTEREYDEAYEKGKSCLVFMLHPDIPVLPIHFERDVTKMILFEKFKDKLSRRHTFSNYTDTSDLVSLITASLLKIQGFNKILSESPLTENEVENEVDIIGLANQQKGINLEEVWVYAPLPLEDINGQKNNILAKQVYDNISNGVKYTYFVESYEAINRIKCLVNDLINKFELNVSEVIKSIFYKNIRVVVLEPTMFLTNYTLHHFRGGIVEVFQSVIAHDRNDKMSKLDRYTSRKVFELISEKIKYHSPIPLIDMMTDEQLH